MKRCGPYQAFNGLLVDVIALGQLALGLVGQLKLPPQVTARGRGG